jgi:hypothetical protein
MLPPVFSPSGSDWQKTSRGTFTGPDKEALAPVEIIRYPIRQSMPRMAAKRGIPRVLDSLSKVFSEYRKANFSLHFAALLLIE